MLFKKYVIASKWKWEGILGYKIRRLLAGFIILPVDVLSIKSEQKNFEKVGFRRKWFFSSSIFFFWKVSNKVKTSYFLIWIKKYNQLKEQK